MDPASSTPNNKPPIPRMPVIFYDGECGFCNGSIQFVLRHEKTPSTLFAPIQGLTAKQIIATSSLPPNIGESTIILFENSTFRIRSSAALRIMTLMGGTWSLLSTILQLVPTPLADTIYRVIARYRKNLPAGESCTLLPPEQRKRFLP